MSPSCGKIRVGYLRAVMSLEAEHEAVKLVLTQRCFYPYSRESA